MSNTCRRNNTYFIDEHNGFNNGYYVKDIKEVLRKMGINVSDEYSPNVTHFVYCIVDSTTPSRLSSVESTNQGEDSIKDAVVRHTQLLKNAIESGKYVCNINKSLIEPIAVAAAKYGVQYGYPLLNSIKRPADHPMYQNDMKAIQIHDDTLHYKTVSLDKRDYEPPRFEKDCPQGVSPFINRTLWKQMSEDLHRKHCHLEMDAQSRKEGHISPNNWKEMYLKRNVKKKQMKTRTCEVCRVSYSNYLDHIATPQHIANINSPHYFDFLKKIFQRFLQVSWKCVLNDYNKSQKQKSILTKQPCLTIPSLDSHVNINCFFPRECDPVTSPLFSSLSTETADSSELRYGNSESVNNLQDSEPSILNQCLIQNNDTITWLFPQFYSFVRSNRKTVPRLRSNSSLSSSTSLSSTTVSNTTKIRNSRHTVKRKSRSASPMFIQKPVPAFYSGYPMGDAFRTVPSQQWTCQQKDINQNASLQNNPYSDVFSSQYIPSSITPLVSHEGINTLFPCTSLYQSMPSETAYGLVQPTLISNDTPITFEPYNTYSPVVPIGYPVIPNPMMSNYGMCDKMESTSVPIITAGSGMGLQEREKRIGTEIVELVHTNSSSIPAFVSPVSDLVPCISPCGDTPNDDIKK